MKYCIYSKTKDILFAGFDKQTKLPLFGDVPDSSDEYFEDHLVFGSFIEALMALETIRQTLNNSKTSHMDELCNIAVMPMNAGSGRARDKMLDAVLAEISFRANKWHMWRALDDDTMKIYN